MKIARIDVYGYGLTYVHGSYVMSGGRVVERLQSTVVRVTTEDGLQGFGETCPLGPAYLEGHARGAREALHEIAPAILGSDPRESTRLEDRMDAALRGHGYAKAAVAAACWDILGVATELPVCTLLGGRRTETFPLYIAVPLGTPAAMASYVEARRAEGIHRFQLKLGSGAREDAKRVLAVLEATRDEDLVIADANGGLRAQEAVVAARLLEGLDRVYLEQPCPTLEECAYVRRLTTLPLVLDEVITDTASLLRAWHMNAMDAINLKVSKVGGLTRARRMRELAEALGISMTIEDSWGGDLVTAAVSHLAASAHEQLLFTVSFMNDWTNEHIAGYEPRSHNGLGSAPTKPGLGIDVDVQALGKPLFSVAA